MSLPKRGSAKPGAGATPARVPEIEAGPTNQKAAQPPIPKPTEATGTREHRSYSEVASSDRFAVIAKGYPTALLSTKEHVMVREAILDKIREQRQGAVKPYFTGCSLRPGQNSALRIGDWRILNRVERGKHVELTLSVEPVSDDLLKSQGYTLCYGFGLVNVRPRNRQSVGVKDTAAEPEPGTASTTQVQEASQELPCCSNSIAPRSNTPEEEKEKAGGSTLEGLLTSAKAAKMERPATNTPQVARMRPPLYGRLPNKPGKGTRRSQEETVLLGSNRASDVLCCTFAKEDLHIALLQEPWILSGKIKGLNTRKGNLIYAYKQQRPRAALLLKKMTFVPLSQFITEDLVAGWAKVPTASGEQEAVLASAYFPGDSSDAPPREVSALVEYCQDKRIRWIIGCDANAHHTVWGSTDVNKMGNCGLRYHLKKLNLSDTETCRFCALQQEISEHVLCEYPALCRRREQSSNVVVKPPRSQAPAPNRRVPLAQHRRPSLQTSRQHVQGTTEGPARPMRPATKKKDMTEEDALAKAKEPRPATSDSALTPRTDTPKRVRAAEHTAQNPGAATSIGAEHKAQDDRTGKPMTCWLF
ncbi:hypothetical protein ACLKA7_001353 [Drosophila subpalustris]